MVESAGKRIVSLLPGGTEIVCALGLEGQLVGRSHECDFPEAVKKLPVCSEPKIDIRASSLDINRQVKEVIERALSIYRVDADRLKQLKPDFVITQSQCEVCAVSPQDVEEAFCKWTISRPEIISLEPGTLADIWKDILRVAGKLGVPDQGSALVSSLQNRAGAITERTNRRCRRPGVACIEWIEPLMTAGNWVPELVERAGGESLFGEPGKHSPWLDWDNLIRREPEIVVIFPCGFDIKRTKKEISTLTGKEEWKNLKSVKNKKVYIADGNQFFNRPGPRIIESLEILAEIFHPDLFHFGHQGKGWEVL